MRDNKDNRIITLKPIKQEYIYGYSLKCPKCNYDLGTDISPKHKECPKCKIKLDRSNY